MFLWIKLVEKVSQNLRSMKVWKITKTNRIRLCNIYVQKSMRIYKILQNLWLQLHQIWLFSAGLIWLWFEKKIFHPSRYLSSFFLKTSNTQSAVVASFKIFPAFPAMRLGINNDFFPLAAWVNGHYRMLFPIPYGEFALLRKILLATTDATAKYLLLLY